MPAMLVGTIGDVSTDVLWPMEVLPAKHLRDRWKTRKGSICEFTVVNDFAAAGCVPVIGLAHDISSIVDLT
jgi:hypothetical protein